ncbi:L-threonylcarbamoyladenylate synthase [Corticicoccus populi]|uniref:Threonylcarbamoyl-AMP synthase n=1 Tax=Corticicoccus populi TaxID=1812821 RepID=A0ABW5WW84_9STAP
MDTKVWKISTEDVDSESALQKLKEIKTAITYGEVVGLPTETVYGLAGDATNPEAINKIFNAKGRPSDNPLIVHIHSIKQLENFVEINDSRVSALMEHFWPGPISFILPLKGDYLPSRTVAELPSVAVRMPSHAVGRKVLQFVDVPLAAPSANISGKPSPTDFSHVIDDLNGKVYGVIASEPADYGIESTVLDCTTFPYRIARPGAVTKEDLESVLENSVDAYQMTMDKPIAPGMKYKHYAPRQPLTIVEESVMNWKISEARNKKIGVIAPETTRDKIPEGVKFVSLCMDAADYRNAARNLYGALRIMDKSDVDEIYIYAFHRDEHSEALLNRIYKAAGDEIIKEG